MRMKPAILERLRGVQRAGAGWKAFCPAHEDQRTRSLSVSAAPDGTTLVHCFAGCPADKIVAAAGMMFSELFAQPAAATSKSITATYDYHDERGALLFQVVRFEPKDFRQRRPDGGGWSWSVAGVRRVVYRLHELAEIRRVYHVEGENGKALSLIWVPE